MITESSLLCHANSKLRISVATIVGIATTIAIATPGKAAQIQYISSGNVSAINNLVIDGTTYDVTFKFDTFVNVFGYPDSPTFSSPTFWHNPQGAKNAVESIATLGNKQPNLSQINNNSSVLVPYGSINASNGWVFITNKIDDYITQWSTFKGGSEDIFRRDNEKANYAVFSAKASAVPEPGFLVQAGVALVLGLKFKRRYLN